MQFGKVLKLFDISVGLYGSHKTSCDKESHYYYVKDNIMIRVNEECHSNNQMNETQNVLYCFFKKYVLKFKMYRLNHPHYVYNCNVYNLYSTYIIRKQHCFSRRQVTGFEGIPHK